MNLLACRLACIAALLFLSALGKSTYAQERAHEIVKQSLLHLVVTGTPATGPNIGVENGVVSQGTGFFVSQDGFILTTRHLFAPIDDADAVHMKITGRIGSVQSRELNVQMVSDLKRFDMVLLRADIPFDHPVPAALRIGSTHKISTEDPPQMMTSGFHNDNYRRRVVELNDTESASLPYAWTLNVRTNSGQSGSPVYIENERGVSVIGIVKATAREDDELTLMVPVEYSMPLIGHFKYQELSDKVDYLLSVIGDITDTEVPLNLRVSEIEGYVEEIESHFTWDAQSTPDGAVKITYEKIISGGPQVDQIDVSITPNMRFYEDSDESVGERIFYTASVRELRLSDNGRFERDDLDEQTGIGEFVIPGIASSLANLVDLTASAVGGPEPYRDIEIKLIPKVGEQPLSARRLTVLPDFDWDDFTIN